MRRQPVAFFLGDAAFPADAKFRRLSRILTDPDDFNSAVGAYFVALAAARRNGLPSLDVSGETASRFIPQLIEVGLLTEDGFPEHAFREWAPARPPRPSESKPSEAPSAPSGVESVESAVSAAPSPPLTSNQPPVLPEGGAGGSAIPKSVQSAWEEATGRTILASGQFPYAYLDDACQRHQAYDVIVKIKRARAQFDHVPEVAALAMAVKKLLDPPLDDKAVRAAAEPPRRRAGTPDPALLRARHNTGAHVDAPDADCPSCAEGAA